MSIGSDHLVAETLRVAGDLLGTRLRPLRAPFPGSRRTLVVRAADPSGRSVVVKRYVSHGVLDAYAREASALSALAGIDGSPAPRVLAESGHPRLVVLEDLGDAPHLAEHLLGVDPEMATRSLVEWADAVARLHVAGRGLRDAFAAGVRGRDPFVDDVDYLPGQLAAAAETWERLGAALDLPVPVGLLDTVSTLPSRFRLDAHSLSAADMCPDNNLVGPDRLRLLDFEFAVWRHIAWDAAYLYVPWPTCWCAWSLDPSAAKSALERWRSVVAAAWPDVSGPDLDHDLALAREGWAWLAGSWCVAGLVDDTTNPPNPAKPSPRMPDRSLRFLRTAAEGIALPELAPLARVLAERIVERYAAREVPLAPAFRGGC